VFFVTSFVRLVRSVCFVSSRGHVHAAGPTTTNF